MRVLETFSTGFFNKDIYWQSSGLSWYGTDDCDDTITSRAWRGARRGRTAPSSWPATTSCRCCWPFDKWEGERRDRREVHFLTFGTIMRYSQNLLSCKLKSLLCSYLELLFELPVTEYKGNCTLSLSGDFLFSTVVFPIVLDHAEPHSNIAPNLFARAAETGQQQVN